MKETVTEINLYFYYFFLGGDGLLLFRIIKWRLYGELY